MSASLWDDMPLASADGLLTTEDCFMLLDVDFFDVNSNDDLLKNLSNAAKSDPTTVLDEATTLYPPSPSEAKPSRAELAHALLQQLDTEFKQENIFPNWLEEKTEFPIFENITQAPAERVEVPAVVPCAVVPTYGAQPTEELLREFESVYGAVELTHLTPPQSPPGPATQLLLSYAHQAQLPAPTAAAPLLPVGAVGGPYGPIGPLCQPSALEVWPAAAQPLYDSELQVVEELVRHRAAELASPPPSGDSATASPQSSPHSSPHSSPPSSSRSSADEDWTSPSRAKPYSRSVDDRRSRKKEQNKNAATRYRQKKKAEIEVLVGQEQSERQRNAELREKCSDVQREIRFIKELMRDLFKAKGLIK